MKRLLSVLIFLLALAAGLFFLRHQILWLDSFEGRVVDRTEDSVATVGKDVTQNRSTFSLEIETDDGRTVTVEVDQLTYFDAQANMRVSKRPFSSEVVLGEP